VERIEPISFALSRLFRFVDCFDSIDERTDRRVCDTLAMTTDREHLEPSDAVLEARDLEASQSDAASRQAIVDVTIRYTWALDTKDFDQLRDVFLPDATAELRGVLCDGVDAIIERIAGAVRRLDATQHLIGNHQVTVVGDTASSRCQLQSQHVKRGTPGGDNFLIGGVYEDQLVRTPAGWRIAHRVMRQTWADGNPAVVARG
jgi:3-phenylpropionate/cinnamic acid dioxygenase small subunit